MIDELIENHVRIRIREAYPDLEENQIIVQFPDARITFSESHNKRNNDGKWAVCQETVTCMISIASEKKLDRALLIRKLPRKIYQFGDYTALQECQRIVNADLVETVGMKGLICYVDYTYTIYD